MDTRSTNVWKLLATYGDNLNYKQSNSSELNFKCWRIQCICTIPHWTYQILLKRIEPHEQYVCVWFTRRFSAFFFLAMCHHLQRLNTENWKRNWYSKSPRYENTRALDSYKKKIESTWQKTQPNTFTATIKWWWTTTTINYFIRLKLDLNVLKY